jgi:catechol 2,3-dioxygenase-like lactoylglutathione lyase family enzyme
MIIGAHTILFAHDPDRARAFLRDVLGLPHVDAGGGWLLFRSPPAELAVHPADTAGSGRQELYLMCDDVEATVARLADHGVACAPVHTERWGLVTTFELPGAGPVGLYEPRHPLAFDLST